MSVTIDNAIQLVQPELPFTFLGVAFQCSCLLNAWPAGIQTHTQTQKEEEEEGSKGSFGVLSDIPLMTRHNDSI